MRILRNGLRIESFSLRLYNMMKLKDLLSEIEVLDSRLDGSAECTALLTDSRRAVSGGLFFAISGRKEDGNDYVEQAVDRGVVAVVSEQAMGKHFPIDYIQVPNARLALAKIAKKFYGSPDRSLAITGVTGTNGKTTVSMLAQHLLGGSQSVGLIGTIRYDIGKRTLPSHRTTPESLDCFQLLSEMCEANCKAAVMEVSSHGIDQYRVHTIEMDTVVFLNLSRDHMDYHSSIEDYFQVKQRLFTGVLGTGAKRAIVNSDCPHGQMILAGLAPDMEGLSFGMNAGAKFRAIDLELAADGTRFSMVYPEGQIEVRSPLIGRHNVYNALAALAIAYVHGYRLSDCVQALTRFPGVPGRMEQIHEGQDFSVLVDYAHTADAIEHACEMLGELSTGKKIIVFGCGGNRDRGKRVLMMRAALNGADSIFVTADNPRSEAIESIFMDMRSGIESKAEAERVQFIEDRKNACARAFESASEGDCVLIAGKGHEVYQEIQGTMMPFDDRKVARELLENRGSRKSDLQ